MKYNILSGQMWPSWVFGPSGAAELPPRCLLEPRKGPIRAHKSPNFGRGRAGIIEYVEEVIKKCKGKLELRLLVLPRQSLFESWFGPVQLASGAVHPIPFLKRGL